MTKWFLFGQIVYVSVNDKVPTDDTFSTHFAKIPANGLFWAAILEKAWAKVWGSYAASLYVTVNYN